MFTTTARAIYARSSRIPVNAATTLAGAAGAAAFLHHNTDLRASVKMAEGSDAKVAFSAKVSFTGLLITTVIVKGRCD